MTKKNQKRLAIALLILAFFVVRKEIGIYLSLREAVEAQSVTAVKAFLWVGADPKRRFKVSWGGFHSSPHYSTVLSTAVRLNNLEIVKLLVENGAPISGGGPWATTDSPYRDAIFSNRFEIVDYFISSVDQDFRENIIDIGFRSSLSQVNNNSRRTRSCSYIEEVSETRNRVNDEYVSRFLFFADKYADEKLLRVAYSKRVTNREILSYLFNRKVYPTDVELILQYIQYPELVKLLIESGYDVNTTVNGKRFMDLFSDDPCLESLQLLRNADVRN